MNENEELFVKAPVSKAFFSMVIPCIITTLVMVIYNMADTFFVGQTGDVNQVAAVSVTTPIFMMMMAVANVLGIGGSAAIGNALGTGNEKRAKNLSAFSAYASIIVGVIIMALILIFQKPLLQLLGTSENTYEMARSYTIVIAIGTAFILFSNALGHVVRAEGAANVSMIGNMIGTVINIILDPVFILAMGMGTMGAALATVIGNLCGSIYFIWYFVKKSPSLSIRFSDFKVGDGIGSSVVAIGLPSGLASVFMSVSTIFVNVCLVSYGDAPVAAWGVASKANMLIVLLQMGIGNGIQALLAFNYGAGHHKRFQEILRFGMVFSIGLGIVLTAIYMIGSQSVVRIFIDDMSVIEDGARMLRALSLSGLVIGTVYVGVSSMQSMSRALPSTLISICRQGIVFIPVLLVMRAVMGMNGIIYAQAVADYVTIILSAITLFYTSRKYLTGDTN